MRKSLATLLALALAALPASAQFFLTGNDPGRLRWNSIETPYYQIVFPEGSDSLARVYARQLEQFRVPLGRSIGELPAQGQRKKLPVILHTHYPYSNGMMGWAPRRMDLFTMPEPYGSDPVPWSIQLASHEPRHLAQLQLGGKGFMKAFPYIFGEAWHPVGWYLYSNSSLGEGDAMAAETGLASGTRGRTADFLNYFRVALDQGEYRSWERWYFGSYKHYTPDLYKISYMSIVGARYLLDEPYFSRDVLNRSLRRAWPFSPYNVKDRIKKQLGHKKFKDSYREVMDVFGNQWKADTELRGPFLQLETITPAQAFPTSYRGSVWADGTLYTIRSGYVHADELLAIRGGKIHRLRSFASNTSPLSYDPVQKRLYWSEVRRDPRWTLAGSSVICYYDIRRGKNHTLTRGTRWYNPQPSADGTRLAVVEYHTDGSQMVLEIDSENGRVLSEYRVPSGLQATEVTWLDGQLYAVGVERKGYGLYRIDPEGFKTILEPTVQKVVSLRSVQGALEWTSDRSGVNELYRFDPSEGSLQQLTSTRYGASDFCHADGVLYCSSQTLDGKLVFRVKESTLEPRSVNYADVYDYPIETRITEQELSLGSAPDLDAEVPVSAPKRYGKLSHTRLHSWMPFYIDYNTILGDSMDFSYQSLSLGLSGFFQNTLSTFSGRVGYGIHPDMDNKKVWRNALHVRALYTGLLPVFEFSLDFGDRCAWQYFVENRQAGVLKMSSVGSAVRKEPLLTSSLKMYIPLQFQRGGVLYGFTPQLRYTISNHLFAREPVQYFAATSPVETNTVYSVLRPGAPDSVIMQRLSGSVRGYWMLPRPQSAVYPRWGIGLEAGMSLRPGLTGQFAPNVYGYAYGYVPGFWRSQGWRFTGMVQKQLKEEGTLRYGELAVNTLPRGFDGTVQARAGRLFPLQWKATADYAIPLYFGDLAVPGFFYIRNFQLTPHGDITGLGGQNYLWSAGADLTAKFNQILIFNFDINLGVSFNYLGGSWYKSSGQEKPWSVEMIFSVDI